ncbi:hypothetical protein LOD99_13286 [Oopsacas minuta]|uniref:DUF4817 domain-containing protein n=1 Tax=Oopsacas minuta TaxID=111878 RepID=A0AAV7KNP0_9METZ|nr:hypothetical protein LOD99_13286 [Oopsacas minuta]
MTRLKLEGRTNVLKWYYKNHGSIVTTQRRFRRFYNSRTAPIPDTIKNIVKRRLSRELELSRTTVRRILEYDLNLFSYMIQVLQKQSIVQKEKRLTLAKLIVAKVEKEEIGIGNIDWSDGAHFHLTGYVNKQNMRI